MITTIFLCMLFKGIIIYEHLLNLASSLCIGNGIVHCCLFGGLELHFHKLYIQSFHYIFCLVKHLSKYFVKTNQVQVNPHLPHLSLVLALVPCFLVARSHNSTRPSSCCNVYQAVMSSISSCVQAMMTSFLAIRIGCTSHNELCSMLTGDIIWYASAGSSFCCPCWVRQNLHKNSEPYCHALFLHCFNCYFCFVMR